ncbi:MAG: hypothetical protein FWB74_10320, partial [Defluviitaleaceae bacterium]|nr:hypothetical protein [Defluviitaleaceae bacterium]
QMQQPAPGTVPNPVGQSPSPPPPAPIPISHHIPPPVSGPPRKKGIGMTIAMIGIIAGVVAIGVVAVLFIANRGFDYVDFVQGHQRWVYAGMDATYSQVFNRFVHEPTWTYREGAGVMIVEITGHLRDTGESLRQVWWVYDSPRQPNYAYITPRYLTLGEYVFTSAFEIDLFSHFIFDAYHRGLFSLPVDELFALGDDLIDPALFGTWTILDHTAAGWFVGGETLTFFEDGFGIERLGVSTWEFEWFADGLFLELDYFNDNMLFEYTYIVLGNILFLTDQYGNTVEFTRNALGA